MGMPVRKRRYSIEEYLELELHADERHEYQDGEILAMAGGFIIANFVREAAML